MFRINRLGTFRKGVSTTRYVRIGIRVYLYNNDQINNVTSMNVPNVKYYLIAGLFTSFKCELGRERAR